MVTSYVGKAYQAAFNHAVTIVVMDDDAFASAAPYDQHGMFIPDLTLPLLKPSQENNAK